MKKNLLKQLVHYSYTKEGLNREHILEIVSRLSRKELKLYIKALKQSIKEKTVIVETPLRLTKEQLTQLENIFVAKKVVLKENPSLIAGLRITNNDDIIELNLSHKLDIILEYVSTNN